jgi:hypothetical protein
MGAQRIDDPMLYVWELDETHTRYQYPRASPSEDTLRMQFAILATVNGLTAVACLIFIAALLRSRRQLLQKTFNLYVLFIAIPDFAASFFCLLTCAMSATISEFYSEAMCGFQAFYLCWAFTSNAWMNAVITFQIHKLLRDSNVRRHYKPPTTQSATKHAIVVFTFATFMGLMNAFFIPWLPHESHLYYGFACFGMEYDRASTFFFWLAFVPLVMGIPILYATYVVFDIWRRKLLPPIGRRRALAIFLLRLVFLYFAIWLPFVITTLVGNFVPITPWIFWSGTLISHMQGLVSVVFCLTNKDMRFAVWDLVSCGKMELSSSSRRTGGSSSRPNNNYSHAQTGASMTARFSDSGTGVSGENGSRQHSAFDSAVFGSARTGCPVSSSCGSSVLPEKDEETPLDEEEPLPQHGRATTWAGILSNDSTAPENGTPSGTPGENASEDDSSNYSTELKD